MNKPTLSARLQTTAAFSGRRAFVRIRTILRAEVKAVKRARGGKIAAAEQ
jgi:hypothetical protein